MEYLLPIVAEQKLIRLIYRLGFENILAMIKNRIAY